MAQFVNNLSGTEIYSLTIPAGMILPHHLVALAPRRKTNALTLLTTAVLWLPLFVMLTVLAVREGQDARPYAAALAIAAVLFLAAAVMTLGLIRPIAIVPSRLKDDAGLTRMTMAIAVTALVFVYALVMSSLVFASAYSLGFFIPFGVGYTCATRPTLLNSRDALWPRIESTDQMIADSDGSLRTARMWKLIIENKADKLAREVRFRFQEPDGRPSRQFDDRYAYDVVEILPAGGSQEFPLRVTPRQSGQAICVITWTDDRGERETRATVRTF